MLMSARARLRLFALVCAATIAVGCESASAAFAVDTSRLPRITGSREVYASPTSTSFVTRETATRAFEITATALINDDWQPYDDPSTPRTSDASIRMSFKKEGRALSLIITTAPAQANATSVSYTELALRNDLPFPKDATAIKFDPERPYLSFITARDAEATLDYFRNELSALGWSLWSTRDGARQGQGGIAGELTANGARATYVRGNDRPLMLTLSRRTDNGFNVEVMTAPAGQLAALREKPAAAAPTGGAAPAELIPVPHASEDVDFDGSLGALRFTNRASAGIVAEYYRSKLSELGWQERPTRVDNEQMVMLRFANGAKDLSIAIVQTGSRTKVTVEGSGLKVATAMSRSM
jgi:hypothetical protein